MPSRGDSRTQQKLLLSLLVIGVLGGVMALGVSGSFSATTQSAGNELRAGTVEIGDNDSAASLYNSTAVKPGDTTASCIKVSYTGSIAASVLVYANGTPATLAPYIDLTITQGTQSAATFPSCTGFVADSGGPLFSGTLQSLEQTHGGYATGIPTGSSWASGDARVYRVQTTLQSTAPDSAQGTSTGPHSFIWEARSN